MKLNNFRRILVATFLSSFICVTLITCTESNLPIIKENSDLSNSNDFEDESNYLRQDDGAWDSIGRIGKKYTLKLLETDAYLDSTIFLNNEAFANALGISETQLITDFEILQRNSALLMSYFPDSTDYCETCYLSQNKKLNIIKSQLSVLDNDIDAKNEFINNLKKSSYTTARQLGGGGCSMGYYICVGVCMGLGELPPLCIACIYLCACDYCPNTPGCDRL